MTRLITILLAAASLSCSDPMPPVSATDTQEHSGDSAGAPPTSDSRVALDSLEAQDTSAEVASHDTAVPDVPAPPGCPDLPSTDTLSLGDVADTKEPGLHHASHCQHIVWATPAGALMSHNLSTDVSEELVDAAANVQWPQVHHDTVVYVAGSPPQVHLLDRLSGTTTVLSPTNSPQKRPRISATAVAWEDEGGTFAQVIRYDRSSGVTTTVDPSGADQRFIALSDQGLVWTDFRDEDPNQRWDGDGNDQSELYGHMTGHSPTALVTAPWKQAFPDIDGSRLIWMDWRDVQYDDASLPQPQPKLSHFYVYQGTLKDGSVTESPLAEVQLGSYEGLPTIAGDWVAWAEDEQIAGLRLGSSEVIALSEVKSGADLPVLSSQGLVFRIGEETLRFAPLPSSAPTTP